MLSEIVDAMLMPIAPASVLKRQMAREAIKSLATFKAAEKTRVKSERVYQTSANSAVVGDILTLNGRARRIARDSWYADSIIEAYERNVIGRGITPRATARDPKTGKEFSDFNKAADALFNTWFKDPVVYDAGGRLSGHDMTRLALSEWVTVGEAFAVWSMDTKQEVPFYYQMFEPEQLDYTKSMADVTGNRIYHGVEVNDRGTIVGYHVFLNNHPYDTWVTKKIESTRIPAERVLHLMKQRRVGQVHGYTRFAPVMDKILGMDMYDQFMLVRAKMEACIGGAIESTNATSISNFGLNPAVGEGTTANNDTEIVMEPGMMTRLNPGETIKFNTPSSPGNGYESFSWNGNSQIGAGVGLDGAIVARDFTRGSYSAQRQAYVESKKGFDLIEEMLIIQWLMPQWKQVIQYGIDSGKLEAPGYDTSPAMKAAYLSVDWQGPDMPPLDEVKEASANQLDLANCTTTLAQIWNRKGMNWRDALKQREEEVEAMKKAGLVQEPDNGKMSQPAQRANDKKTKDSQPGAKK